MKLASDTLAVEKVTTLMISDMYNNHPIKTAPKYCVIFFILTFVLVLIYEYKGNIKEWLKK
jgi:hypothetical protein